MSTAILVVKNEAGKLEGLGEKCQREYERFLRYVRRLEPGECFTLDVWIPRNPKFHRLHFVMLARLFDAQEQFTDADHLRMWLQVGAGYCDYVPGAKGKPVAIPLSIKWAKMDENAFAEHHEKIKAFMRAPYCTRYLWPHLSDQAASDIIEGILRDFEGERT